MAQWLLILRNILQEGNSLENNNNRQTDSPKQRVKKKKISEISVKGKVINK